MQTDIKFKTTAKGQRRAYRFGGYRWLPMPLAEAELLIATGKARDVTATAIW